jgi:hypothetical protein
MKQLSDGELIGEPEDCAKVVYTAKRNAGIDELHVTLNQDGSFTLIVSAKDISMLCGIVPGREHPIQFLPPDEECDPIGI